MSNEPARNPFAAPDPDHPAPPAPEPPRQDPGGGPGKTPREDPTPPSMEELKEASGKTFRFGALLILALLGSQLPLPYTLAAPVLIVAAVVFGVIALRRSWAISRRSLMTPMLIAGIVMALMMSITVASKFALWPVEMERQECARYAITNSAKAECVANYEKAVSERLDSLRGFSSAD